MGKRKLTRRNANDEQSAQSAAATAMQFSIAPTHWMGVAGAGRPRVSITSRFNRSPSVMKEALETGIP